MIGSSPHTWGIRLAQSRILSLHSVHPHIRGAYRLLMAGCYISTGSSPHTWGIRLEEVKRICAIRFIPTYVGHTVESENYNSIVPGSSPHTWGILDGLHIVLPPVRFIPTYVGHTRTFSFLSSSYSVHPHIRGAYVTLSTTTKNIYGSSPHTWGIPDQGRFPGRFCRFIPTYVGHTNERNENANRSTVHPHIRGAYVTPLFGL